LRQRKFAEAEPILREVVTLQTKACSDHWSRFGVQSMLGEALSGQKKFVEAEPLLIAGYEGMKQRAKSVPPQGSWLFDQAVERVVRHYEAQGKPDEVAKWRKELKALKGEDKKPEKQP